MEAKQNPAVLMSLPPAKPKQLAPLVGARPIVKPAGVSSVPWEQPTIPKTAVDIVKLARRQVSPEPIVEAQLPGAIDHDSPRPKTPESTSSSKHSRGRRSTVSNNLEETVPKIDTSGRRDSPVDISFLSKESTDQKLPSSRKLSLPSTNPKEHGVIETESELDKEVIESLFRAGRQSNYKQVIEILEKYPYIDIDIRDEFENTLLIVAASQNCKRLLKECLRRGANINAQNWQGNTAAHQAFRFRYHELGNYILEKGANIMICNQDEQSVLSFAEESADRLNALERKSS